MKIWDNNGKRSFIILVTDVHRKIPRPDWVIQPLRLEPHSQVLWFHHLLTAVDAKRIIMFQHLAMDHPQLFTILEKWLSCLHQEKFLQGILNLANMEVVQHPKPIPTLPTWPLTVLCLSQFTHRLRSSHCTRLNVYSSLNWLTTKKMRSTIMETFKLIR